MTAMTKPELRRLLRSRFAGQSERAGESGALCRHIIASDVYKAAAVVGGYVPMRHEADITPVLLDALENGKNLALPLCGNPPQMTMRQVSSLDSLVQGAYGLLEPDAQAPIILPKDIDLLLVPLEGIDAKGCRLGKGGGYYDALLANEKLKTIGCVLSWQWVEEIPCDEWDHPLDACADAAGIYVFRKDIK